MRCTVSLGDGVYMHSICIVVISTSWLVLLSAVAGGSDPAGRVALA